MPTLTLVSGRTPIQAYEINSTAVTVGRDADLDIVVDHPSVSRRQARVRLEPSGQWAVEDLESANGTFLNGERVAARQPLARGDEISFGAFSLFFDRTFEIAPAAARPAPAPAPTETILMDQEDVARLQREVAMKRRAHLRWEARGQRGTFYLDDAERAAVLIGRSSLCDLPVPAGPPHHLLVSRRAGGFEVRNLSAWHRLRVNGQPTRRARLRSGDVMDVGGRLRLTFVDALE